MQRNANGALRHLEPVGCLADAVAIERYGSDDLSLLRLQSPEQRIDVTCGQLRRLIFSPQAVHDVVDWYTDVRPAAPENVDELIPGDRSDPRPDRP
jgi:hypothetical protein